MPPRARLPMRPEYADLPVWNHNFDNVQTRIVNYAWNALFEVDLEDLSFKAMATELGVTPPAIYHYYPSLGSLGAELAYRACITLHSEITETTAAWDPPRPKSLDQVVARYLAFAQKRPRHFALMFSPRFRGSELLHPERLSIGSVLCDLLELEIGAAPEIEDVQVFWGIIHGSACLVAAGQIAQPERLLLACKRYIEGLRLPRS